MSLAVYILVASAGADGVKPACEVIWLGDELVRAGSLAAMVDETGSVVAVALDNDELVVAGSTSLAICEGLKTNVRLLRSVHVVSFEWQPVVFRPQVNLLRLPSSLQAVIATPELGLSVGQDVSAQSSSHILDPCSSFVHLFCSIQRTHRSPSSHLYSSLCLRFHGENIARRPNIERRHHSMMHGRCLWCKVCQAKACRPGSSSSALLSSRQIREWTPVSPGEGS
jgi:hypothetical protein